MSYKEWQYSTISEVSKRVKVGFVGSISKYYTTKDKGIPLLRTTNLTNKGLDFSDIKHVTKEFHQKNHKSQIKRNDILIARHGDNGKACLYNESFEANALNVVIIEPNPKKVIPNFLKYHFDNPQTINIINGSLVGSVQNVINTKAIANLSIMYPSVKEQKAITNILSSLDDKIELNNKINKNLEQLAQTLYKRWFVDFEFPNEDGEPYRSSGGEMVESEWGLIPKEWNVLTLDELLVKSKTKINPDSNQKLIDMANMPSYSIALNSFDYGDKLSTNTYKMNKFSFLYGSIRPYLGKFGIAPFDGITTGTIHNFNVKDNFDYSLVATTVFSTKFNEFCIKLSHGTKMPTIKWDDFVSFKVIYSHEISYKFNKIVRVMFDQIVNNVLENVKLSKLRDELLPKLMNGEIEVPIEE